MHQKKLFLHCFVFLFIGILSFFLNLGRGSYAHDVSPAFYTVEGITVDITDESAIVAREKALLEAQKKALSTLLGRLCEKPSSFWEHTAPLSDTDIYNLVSDFEITEEKTSSTRYFATFTFRFKKPAIDLLLSHKGVDLPSTPLPKDPVLIIPVLKIGETSYLFEEDNPWLNLWQEKSLSSLNTPLLVPLGDLEDMQSLGVQMALQQDPSGLSSLEDRYKAKGRSLVIIATLKEAEKTIEVDMLGLASPEKVSIPIFDFSLPKRDLLAKALDQVLSILNKTEISFDPSLQKKDLIFTSTFSQKDDWFFLRNTLETLKKDHVILSFSVKQISSHCATILVSFGNTLESLSAAFKNYGLLLREKEGAWILSSSSKKPLASLSSISDSSSF